MCGLKVYVLGKFEDVGRIRRVQAELIDAGHTISHDWTLNEQGPKSLARKRQESIEDVEGVRASDLLVGVFIEDLPYRGAFGEFGMAIISGKPVIVIGHYADRFVFRYHPLVVAWFADIEEFGKHKVYKYGGEVKIKEMV